LTYVELELDKKASKTQRFHWWVRILQESRPVFSSENRRADKRGYITLIAGKITT